MLYLLVMATQTHPMGEKLSDTIYSPLVQSFRADVCISLRDWRVVNLKVSSSQANTAPIGNRALLSDIRGTVAQVVMLHGNCTDVCRIQWYVGNSLEDAELNTLCRERDCSHILQCCISDPWDLSITATTLVALCGCRKLIERILSTIVHFSAKNDEIRFTVMLHCSEGITQPNASTCNYNKGRLSYSPHHLNCCFVFINNLNSFICIVPDTWPSDLKAGPKAVGVAVGARNYVGSSI